MSRPSIPKLSLAFKKTTDSAPLTAQPDKGAALLGVPNGASSSVGGNGSLSAPMFAVPMPKLNLPARVGHPVGVANGGAAAAAQEPPPQLLLQQKGGGGHQEQQQHAEGGQHAVYVLLPGLAFPSHPAGSGGPPLTVGGLKALCYETFCPPRAPSSTSPSPSPPQLEFFRLSALVRLTDDTIPAPPGLVVAGAHLQDQGAPLTPTPHAFSLMHARGWRGGVGGADDVFGGGRNDCRIRRLDAGPGGATGGREPRPARADGSGG
jgi:hypothetical protein